MPEPILRVAVPCPLYQSFDYLPPADAELNSIEPGSRIAVPFGRGNAIGIVLARATQSEIPAERLKRALRVLDTTPVVSSTLLRLALWAAEYYHHPVGEVVSLLLPPRLRRGESAGRTAATWWRLSESGRALDPHTLRRAPRQRDALVMLQGAADGAMSEAELCERDISRDALRTLAEREWVVREQRAEALHWDTNRATPESQRFVLNAAQQSALDAVNGAADQFGTFLLDGVTGSGKTEVYLGTITHALERGHQALVLVPEIGLTPQLVERFKARFAVPLAVLHSGLGDRERLDAWHRAAEGTAPIVIGTRSAVFTPVQKLGLIVVDEEHDTSFKQQEGLRYSARDLAVMRAKLENVPVVLGSATPSIESLHNITLGRYTHLLLPKRAGAAKAPRVHLLDLRRQSLKEGLAPPLLETMTRHLAAGNQVLLFLNRRGYAPVLMCHTCGWVADCPRCDARLTLHLGENRLRCHHCGLESAVHAQCPVCANTELLYVGRGTERIDHLLRGLFPGVPIARVDRDTTRRKGAMANLLEAARSGTARLLIGTQMLAKGHHFPNVTLVAVLEVDQFLFSVDFRGPERLAQTLVQVAGRAGRADQEGEVIIQTHHPHHPMLRRLVEQDYHAFAKAALEEREAAGLPPFSSMALLRAEANTPEQALDFLNAAAARARELGDGERLQILGPAPAPMGKRAGWHRAQLLLQANRRNDLQQLLGRWTPALAQLPHARRVRWSLDVDPVELY